ncbi:DUF4145 domain-containing protein [Henriciella sp.]|uniref:DUF4145 domain-containing protein n=1 Tax=Henriciella sp. TaxID=1968823 RepID=UPI0026271C33|nr:DUF4145 domain-containing protein [Henriciella sp.]
MVEGETTQGHCPDCGGIRNASARKVFQHHIDVDGDDFIWLNRAYAILQCLGCDAVYFRTDSQFSEDEEHVFNHETGEHECDIPIRTSYHPSPVRRDRAEWANRIRGTDQTLQRLLDAVYDALDADLRVLAAIGTRTTFDRASELLGINENLGFGQKLNELRDAGKIGVDERQHLGDLVDAGSAAAHRGWEPSNEQLEVMVTILEAFLHRSFILAAEAGALRDAVPQRRRTNNDTENVEDH